MSTPDIERARQLLQQTNDLLAPSEANGDRRSEAQHSWLPIDLVAAALEPSPPPTISGLVYPGLRHVFSGEPEALKSWAALVICAEQIAAGETVCYIDLEMGRRETYTRLKAISLTDTQITEQFLYLAPEQPLTHEIAIDVGLMLLKHSVTVVVIDAFTGALLLHGYKPDSDIDIEAFYHHVGNPLRMHGAAVILLDHLVKDRDSRGKYAIGSQRKIGACDVHLGFETVKQLSRGHTGRAKITVHKDRPGYLPRPRAGELELVSDPGDHKITWKTTLVSPDEPRPKFRPTTLMESASRHLEKQEEPLSKTQLAKATGGKREATLIGIDLLVQERYFDQLKGPRNAHLVTSARPYREADDPKAHGEQQELT